MLRPPSRFGSLSALLAVVTTLSSAAGPAFARTKKKHPKHAPAAHQTKRAPGHAAGDRGSAGTGRPRRSRRSPPARAVTPPPAATIRKPARRSARRPRRRRSRSASEAAGRSGPSRTPSRHAANESEGENDDETGTTGPRQPPALRGGVGLGAVYRRLTWTGAHSPGLADYCDVTRTGAGRLAGGLPGRVRRPRIRGQHRRHPLVQPRVRHLVYVRERRQSGRDLRGLPAGPEDAVPAWAPSCRTYRRHTRGRSSCSRRASRKCPASFTRSSGWPRGLRAQIANAIDAEVEAAYLAVVDSGKQAGYIGAPEYFPGLGAYGLEAGGSLGVRVTSVFGLRAGVDFRQYALDLSHATGMLMANQATDRYVTIWGGLEIVLDGAGSGGAVKPRSENKPPAPPVNPAD